MTTQAELGELAKQIRPHVKDAGGRGKGEAVLKEVQSRIERPLKRSRGKQPLSHAPPNRSAVIKEEPLDSSNTTCVQNNQTKKPATVRCSAWLTIRSGCKSALVHGEDSCHIIISVLHNLNASVNGLEGQFFKGGHMVLEVGQTVCFTNASLEDDARVLLVYVFHDNSQASKTKLET